MRAIERRTVLKGLASAGAVATLAACDGKGNALSASDKQALNDAVEGPVYWRGDAAYETARGNTAYRANKPKRYPQAIVQATSDKDVVAAVKFAKAHGLRVTTRSGGHSWSSAHIRDGVVLIDLARMQTVEIDPATRTVWTSPAVIGSVLNAQLKQHDLIVPTAHHPSPGIGGFCMNGGFGWNSRLWGNGARQVLAIDVVTADGELIRADATQNSDFWWAARGGGAGFFGVITRMHLQAHPKPKVWMATAYGWDDAAGVFDQLMGWACEVVPKVAPNVEFVMSTTANHRETGEPVPTRISAAALALTDDEAEAKRLLAFFETCPVLDWRTAINPGSRRTRRAIASPRTTPTSRRRPTSSSSACARYSWICRPRTATPSGLLGDRPSPFRPTWHCRCRATCTSAPMRCGPTPRRTRRWRPGRRRG